MIIPSGAYIGGQEDGAPLVICRAPYLGGVYPGKLVKGNCNISFDSREIYLQDFDVLLGQGGQWAPAQPGFQGAFIAGYEHGGPLYLCQALYRGGLHPGKIFDGACDISYAGREIPIRRFNVFYVGAPTVATYGGAPYAPTVIYRYENNTTNVHVYPPRPSYPPAYRPPASQGLSDAQQRASYQRNQQAQQAAEDRARAEGEADENRQALKVQAQANQAAAESRERAAGEADENRQALKAQAQAEQEARQADEARVRAEGEADENRQAVKAQAQAEQEAKQAEEIKRGEEQENRMAAEASARAEAEADAHRQAEIKQGEDEENRAAAEAAKAQEPPPNGDPPNS